MSEQPAPTEQPGQGSLHRQVGIFGATMMGLGSIVGTGIFVSIGVAAGTAGPAVVLAIIVAAMVAACNGLSSAQLAANHPVSGGTYEYGYRWLHPSLGFTAGWMFVCAKTASAATAALGLTGYILTALGPSGARWMIPLAVSAVVLLTVLVLSGIRRSSAVNMVIVSLTLLSLLLFVLAGLPTAVQDGPEHFSPFFGSADQNSSPLAGFLEACALMFVAYTGYGRIATLGEEMHNPARNIPLAIIVTLLVSATLYAIVGTVAVAVLGPHELAKAAQQQAAPLQLAARQLAVPGLDYVVASGAVTAMLGVLLNLILGLSRVVLAMGRRRDVPAVFAKLDRSQTTPYPAVILVGMAIAGLTCFGSIKTTWSFSAFTVLIYYALTNLAALRLSREERLVPRVVPWLGLGACLFLAFWVEPLIWAVGLALIAAGLVWQGCFKLTAAKPPVG